MKKIRFALVGCGNIAQRHAVHIQTYGELVAVCDVNEERAHALAEKYQVSYYTLLENMLSEVTNADVVVICTPNGLHASQSILALQKGCHVLVEKPMAISTMDAKRMMISAEASGKQLFTVMQNRFNPPVMAVKEALDHGWFGKLFSVQLTCLWNREDAYYHNSWRGTKEMDGGVLFTQFSHFIDLLYWFFGAVKKVSAITKNAAHTTSIAIEDSGVVLLEFENGMMGTIHFSVNSYASNREGSVTILGEKGIVKIGGEYLNTIDYQQFENGELSVSADSREANDYGTYRGSMSNHDKVYEDLVAVLQTGKTMYASQKEGLQTIEIVERIYRAANLEKSM